MERRLIILLLLFVVLTGNAQEREHFTLFTDRDLYTSGEPILFKVFTSANERSGIVHIDLINSKGKMISGISKKITDYEADGYVELPDSLSSGFYLLSSSTKTNPTVTFKELYICNRFTGLPEANTALRSSDSDQLDEKPTDLIEIDGLQKEYKTRGKASFTLHLPAEMLGRITQDLFVSIAEVTPAYNSKTFFKRTTPKIDQIIEKEGVILEGTARDARTGEPFKNGIIYLSVPDTLPRFKYYITRSDGRFNFQLNNYYGKIPVVIQGYDRAEKRPLKITLDNRDSLRSEAPVSESWTIPVDLRKNAANNIDVVNFRKLFNHQELNIAKPTKRQPDPYPFYGVPAEVIVPKLFIDLPDFTEIARELMPGVKFSAYNRIPTMQVFSPAHYGYFKNRPLVLLDGIPVRDLNAIKNMGSKEISRIEVCHTERYYGYLSFPGVVAIYSTKPDFTRLLPADDLIKLNLETLQPEVILNSPDEQQTNEMDLRKVLLWKPNVKPGPTITVDFKPSDVRGNFRLIVRGKTKEGTFFYKEQFFEVN